MAKDFMKSQGGSENEGRGSITEAEIGSAYRQLAREHVELRSGSTPQTQTALSKSIWEKVEARSGHGKTGSSKQGPSAAHGAARLYPLSRHPAGSGSPLPSKLRRGRILIAAAACAVAALGGLYLGSSYLGLSGSLDDSAPLSRISFEVEGTTVGPDQSGQGRLIASENGPVGVRLSDKSQINLQPHTTLRLAALSDGVVITRMAQGTLDAEVVHQAHTNYQFFAGPYQVKVIGTAFRLSYEPEGERLDLRMRSGAVEVVGADGESQTVRGGETLHLEGDQKFAAEDSRRR